MSLPNFEDDTPVGRVAKVRGISDSTFDRVTAIAEILYRERQGNIPSIEDMIKNTGLSRKTLVRILSSQEFLSRLAKRGIIWSSKNRITAQITPEQAAVLQILTDPTSKLDLKKRLDRAGITYGVYRNWLKQPGFARVLRATAEVNLDDHLPDFHTRIVEKGLAGDLNAIKFAYELSGRYDPAKQQMVDLSKMVMLLLEVITRYITDQTVLEKINRDVDIILKGKVPPALNEAPEIIEGEVLNFELDLEGLE